MYGFANHTDDKLIYLGSPYSNEDALQQKINFILARDCAAWFLRKGVFVYSPIVHCHDLAIHYDLPHDYDFWKAYNRRMLRAADEFCMLRIQDWDKSKGLKGEIADAKDMGKELFQCYRLASKDYEIFKLEI